MSTEPSVCLHESSLDVCVRPICGGDRSDDDDGSTDRSRRQSRRHLLKDTERVRLLLQRSPFVVVTRFTGLISTGQSVSEMTTEPHAFIHVYLTSYGAFFTPTFLSFLFSPSVAVAKIVFTASAVNG